MDEKKQQFEEKLKKLVEICLWSYKQGFDSAIKILNHSSQVHDLESMRFQFEAILKERGLINE